MSAELSQFTLFDQAPDPRIVYASNIISVAEGLLSHLSEGKAIDASLMRSLMCDAFGGTDSEGKWLWKTAYEAQEVAGVMFMRRYMKSIRNRQFPQQVEVCHKLQSLMMTHTRRSDQSERWQQFSTPFPLALIAAEAAHLCNRDVVLEPSCGTGVMAIMAEHDDTSLWLNEYEGDRHAILKQLFPKARIAKHNAEYLNDLMSKPCQPSVVIMNPPFNNSPTMVKSDLAVTGRHVHSALKRLRNGGRLVAITGHNFAPNTDKWRDAFQRLQETATVTYSTRLAGSLYYKHGTTFDTRMTVFDKKPAEDVRDFTAYDRDPIENLDGLIDALQYIPTRFPLEDVAEPIIEQKVVSISTAQKTKPANELIVAEDTEDTKAEWLEYTIKPQVTSDELDTEIYSQY